MTETDDTARDILDAGGSRSPNGQHIFSTQIGGVPLFALDGGWNPALHIEVVQAGSLLRHPNGAWQAAGWHLRVRGAPPDAPIVTGRVRA